MSDLTVDYASVAALSARLQRRELSPVALTEAVLARAQALQPYLHAFVTLTAERAMAEARAAEIELDAGLSRGPLHGIPYVAKDLFDVAGHPTQAGCPLLADNTAGTDAAVVARLARAGMVLIGKTHTVQFAFGGVGINQDFGTPHNPWSETAHAPGGSSSGTAVAVSAGLVPVGLGSDTGGSVRIPAALCGIAGLKTTVGRVSRAGVYPLSWTLDSVGPLARGVRDCALTYSAMHGPDSDDPTTLNRDPHDVLSDLELGVEGLRICFAETAFWDDADSAVVAAVRAAGEVFENLGARVGSIDLPEAGQVAGGERERHRALVVAAEGCAINRRLLDEHFDALDPHVAHRMIAGRTLSAPDYGDTLRAWESLQASAIRSLRDVDAVLVPTCAITARPLAEIDESLETYARHNGKYLRNTAIGNMLNLCGVSVPCGFDPAGMPIGLTVYAKPFHEEMALRVAHAYEQATEWHTRRPDLGWAGG
jgi:aspartyl-tRNA(Asn)/glutamyl-tRNA(Gln) amidotransferase subunit A